jgi:hypothetical protein
MHHSPIIKKIRFSTLFFVFVLKKPVKKSFTFFFIELIVINLSTLMSVFVACRIRETFGRRWIMQAKGNEGWHFDRKAGYLLLHHVHTLTDIWLAFHAAEVPCCCSGDEEKEEEEDSKISKSQLIKYGCKAFAQNAVPHLSYFLAHGYEFGFLCMSFRV